MRRLVLLAVLTHLLAALLFAQDPQRLRSAVKDWAKVEGDSDTPVFRHAFADLNDDGRADALVLITAREWCGSGGCTMLVFRGDDDGFTFVSKSSITNEPIRVSQEKTGGWKNLIVYAKRVGDVVMRFDGKAYPPNPSLEPKATAAQTKAATTLMEPCCESLYTSEVRYNSFSEPAWVMVEDGHNLRLTFADVGGLLKEDVEKWQEGKRLLIIYGPEAGARLLDPENLKAALILDGLREHPVDLMAQKCVESEAQTTAEMVACYAKGSEMWDRELNRFYRQLMNTLAPEQKQLVQTAQREWLQYRDAQKATLEAVDNDGTLSRVSRAREAMRLTKEQAERLARMLAR